jgi:N-acetylglutamate synthase-like GNAT family acetyltransferase
MTVAVIRPYRPEDQTAARALILDGLREHWGTLDPALNRDLDDIAQTFAGGGFWVAEAQGEIIGTAALLVHGEETGEVVRVSVARAWRRTGLGRRLLAALAVAAQARRLRTLTAETTASWADAIAFYEGLGFERTHQRDGDQYFALSLTRRPAWAT